MTTIDRQAIYERDQGLCGFCGLPVPWELLHIDHVTPRSHGGQTVASNLRVAHKRCNQAAAAQVTEKTKRELGLADDEELMPIQIRFPASLRKRALAVAQDEDRTFASIVIYALRRYVSDQERKRADD